MSELKPCPFCNGHAKINTKRESAGMDGSYVNWIIHCEKCGAMISCPADGFYGRKALTEDKAIEAWNRRAGDDPPIMPELRKGKWILHEEIKGFPDWVCSECGGSGRGDYHYCPWCMAAME